MNFSLLETVVTDSSSLPPTITTFQTSFASPVPFWNVTNNTTCRAVLFKPKEDNNECKFSADSFNFYSSLLSSHCIYVS